MAISIYDSHIFGHRKFEGFFCHKLKNLFQCSGIPSDQSDSFSRS